MREHASGACRKLARLVGREGGEEGENKSSKDCTWSAVPDALLGMIAEEMV